MPRRVVITGIGPVSNIGIGVDAFAAALRAGKVGTTPSRYLRDEGFRNHVSGRVSDFDPAALLRRLDPVEWGRSSSFAAAAARLAVSDAKIDLELLRAGRAGSSIGTTGGEGRPIEAMTLQAVTRGGLDKVEPQLAQKLPASRLAVAVNREIGINGDATTIGTACAAGNYAIGYAADQIRCGEADFMLAGGAESTNRWGYAGFARLGALAPRACSPFDRDRDGVIPGEGGAVVLLETLDSARGRGARVYAEVLGHATNCDAVSMVAPDRARITQCIKRAHRNAGVAPSDIDYISAHGTGTPTNDVVEFGAVRDAFGPTVPPISSIKSMLGHTMGAASAFGAMASALAITEGFLPPTMNLTTVDPELTGIDPVANASREATVNVVQNHGFGFGGNNCILVLGRAA